MTRRGAGLLIALTGLCSGCAGQAPAFVPPAPVALVLPDCPAPDRPILPLLDPALPLDSLGNVEILLSRDDMMRRYIGGLAAAVRCYSQEDAHGTLTDDF
jgi:hypothetical protein